VRHRSGPGCSPKARPGREVPSTRRPVKPLAIISVLGGAAISSSACSRPCALITYTIVPCHRGGAVVRRCRQKFPGPPIGDVIASARSVMLPRKGRWAKPRPQLYRDGKGRFGAPSF
jgi:hypothetical protein